MKYNKQTPTCFFYAQPSKVLKRGVGGGGGVAFIQRREMEVDPAASYRPFIAACSAAERGFFTLLRPCDRQGKQIAALSAAAGGAGGCDGVP